MGDDINEKYADVFDGLISSLHITDTDGGEETYNAFANIARRYVLCIQLCAAVPDLLLHASGISSS